MGIDPLTSEIMIPAKIKSQSLNLLSHPGAPDEVVSKSTFSSGSYFAKNMLLDDDF